MCKMMIYPGISFFFFLILIFWAVRGVKGQKMAQMKKKNSVCRASYLRNHTSYDFIIYIHHVPYLRNSIAYDCGFWYTSVKWRYLQLIFLFFQRWGKRGKRAKNGPKWQKTLSVVPYVPGTIIHMILIYGIHV